MFQVGDTVTAVRGMDTLHGKVTDASSAPVEYQVAFDELDDLVVVAAWVLQREEQ